MRLGTKICDADIWDVRYMYLCRGAQKRMLLRSSITQSSQNWKRAGKTNLMPHVRYGIFIASWCHLGFFCISIYCLLKLFNEMDRLLKKKPAVCKQSWSVWRQTLSVRKRIMSGYRLHNVNSRPILSVWTLEFYVYYCRCCMCKYNRGQPMNIFTS